MHKILFQSVAIIGAIIIQGCSSNKTDTFEQSLKADLEEHIVTLWARNDPKNVFYSIEDLKLIEKTDLANGDLSGTFKFKTVLETNVVKRVENADFQYSRSTPRLPNFNLVEQTGSAGDHNIGTGLFTATAVGVDADGNKKYDFKFEGVDIVETNWIGAPYLYFGEPLPNDGRTELFKVYWVLDADKEIAFEEMARHEQEAIDRGLKLEKFIVGKWKSDGPWTVNDTPLVSHDTVITGKMNNSLCDTNSKIGVSYVIDFKTWDIGRGKSSAPMRDGGNLIVQYDEKTPNHYNWFEYSMRNRRHRCSEASIYMDPITSYVGMMALGTTYRISADYINDQLVLTTNEPVLFNDLKTKSQSKSTAKMRLNRVK